MGFGCIKNLIVCSLAWTIASACLWNSAHTSELRGKVIGVSDGDTITLLTPDHKQLKVRLAEIDAPEKSQPWGKRAKQALSDLVFSKTILVRSIGGDRYGRVLGHVYFSDRYINREVVRNGHAWAYRKYLVDRSLLQDEDHARKNQLGLWSLTHPKPIPPWKWREKQKNNPQYSR